MQRFIQVIVRGMSTSRWLRMPYTAVRGLSSHSAIITSEARVPMAIIDLLFIETVCSWTFIYCC